MPELNATPARSARAATWIGKALIGWTAIGKTRVGATGRRRASRVWLRRVLVIAALGAPQAVPAQTSNPAPLSDEIQLRREDMEKRKQDYLREKALVEDFNARVARYKQIREAVPLLTVPGTTNLLRMYVNRHDLRDVSRQLYFLTDGASEEGFQRDYWPTILKLNQAGEYDGGLPLYGELLPDAPDDNNAVLLNIRKVGLQAVPSELTSEDSLLAQQLTDPAVRAYKRRLRESVRVAAEEAGAPPGVTGPQSMNAAPQVALFGGLVTEVRDEFPPRRPDETSIYANAERGPVVLAAPIATEPTPPALAMRYGVNMLGPEYEGYDTTYRPGKFVLQPEAGAMAFYGGRNPAGNPTTQPGLYFAFNQRLYNFLLFNESAFAAFSADDGPAVNGGVLNAGIELSPGQFTVAGMFGLAAFNVVGETETALSITGRIRYAITPDVYLGAIWMASGATQQQGDSYTGIQDAGFIGLNLTIR